MSFDDEPRMKIQWDELYNLHLFDSELEWKIREASLSTENPTWGRSEIQEGVGLHVWRINGLVVQEPPCEHVGTFYKQDCYLVLITNNHGRQDIYIWIGSESKSETFGAAAFKMIQLDERLGSMTGQHVEHQGKESSAFLSHFKVVTYLDGESVSSANKAAIKAAFMEPRLYMIQVTSKKKRSAFV